MATLQKIRNNAGLLVSIIIGLALLSFILGDLLSAGGSIFGTSKTEVAEIAGKSVSIQSFQQQIDENVENFKRNYGQSNVDQSTLENIQDQTWEELIRNNVMSEEFDKLGVAVSGEELFDMVQGNNIHPQIMQIPIFQNQQTGRFDRNLVIQFLKNMELDPTGNAKASWSAFEKSLAQEQLNTKYNTLIQKGLYVTKVQAKEENKAKNSKINFEYVVVPYQSISDSAITYTQDDLAKYYNENLDKYKQDEVCEISYLTFPIIASEEDDAQTKKMVSDLSEEFATVENVEQYVNLNSDVKFNEKYLSKEELPASIADLYDAAEGTIFGPYKDNNVYSIARVVKFANVPDSVKARHILIRPDKMGAEAAIALGDSLLEVIKKGGDFAELAKKYSADGSAEEGGDLGWFTEGKMVKPFNDACFFGKKGDLVTVNSQFGVHVVEVLDQAKATKKVQIGIISRNIEPSSKTYQATYAQASKFGSSNRTFSAFTEAANKQGMVTRNARLGKNDRKVANLENPRQMVRWAFKASEGDVSEIFELGEVYVIAALKKHYKEGTAPLDQALADVEHEVKKQKKAEIIISRINQALPGASTLEAIAGKLNETVKDASNANFASFSLPGLGVEPEVQGTITALEINEISNPIEGARGIYIVKVNSVVPAAEYDVAKERSYLTTTIASRVRYEVYNAIKDAAKIEDNRANFY